MDILILRRAPGKYRFRLNYIPGSLHWRIVGWRPLPSKKSWIHRCHGENFFYFLSLQRENEIYWKEKCGFSMHFKIKEITSIEKFQISKIFSVFLGFFNLGRFQTVTVTWHLHESESVKPGVFNGTFSGADPGGGPGGPGPPLTLGFEAPKLSIFGPYLIFP